MHKYIKVLVINPGLCHGTSPIMTTKYAEGMDIEAFLSHVVPAPINNGCTIFSNMQSTPFSSGEIKNGWLTDAEREHVYFHVVIVPGYEFRDKYELLDNIPNEGTRELVDSFLRFPPTASFETLHDVFDVTPVENGIIDIFRPSLSVMGVRDEGGASRYGLKYTDGNRILSSELSFSISMENGFELTRGRPKDVQLYMDMAAVDKKYAIKDLRHALDLGACIHILDGDSMKTFKSMDDTGAKPRYKDTGNRLFFMGHVHDHSLEFSRHNLLLNSLKSKDRDLTRRVRGRICDICLEQGPRDDERGTIFLSWVPEERLGVITVLNSAGPVIAERGVEFPCEREPRCLAYYPERDLYFISLRGGDDLYCLDPVYGSELRPVSSAFKIDGEKTYNWGAVVDLEVRNICFSNATGDKTNVEMPVLVVAQEGSIRFFTLSAKTPKTEDAGGAPEERPEA